MPGKTNPIMSEQRPIISNIQESVSQYYEKTIVMVKKYIKKIRLVPILKSDVLGIRILSLRQ